MKQYKTLSTKNNPTPISAIRVQKRPKKPQNNRASSNHTTTQNDQEFRRKSGATKNTSAPFKNNIQVILLILQHHTITALGRGEYPNLSTPTRVISRGFYFGYSPINL